MLNVHVHILSKRHVKAPFKGFHITNGFAILTQTGNTIHKEESVSKLFLYLVLITFIGL